MGKSDGKQAKGEKERGGEGLAEQALPVCLTKIGGKNLGGAGKRYIEWGKTRYRIKVTSFQKNQNTVIAGRSLKNLERRGSEA